MALAFVLPLVSRAAAGAIGLPLAPLTVAAVLALTVRRALIPATESAARAVPGANSKMHLSLAPEH